MTIQEFEQLPCRRWDEDIGEFESLILLPYRDKFEEAVNEEELAEAAAQRIKNNERKAHIHDSGYRFMNFVAADVAHPICRLNTGSDILHIGGIGGKNISCIGNATSWSMALRVLLSISKQPISWSIDCLPTSGLLRLFAPHCKLIVGVSLSSFEVCAIPEKENKKDEKTS